MLDLDLGVDQMMPADGWLDLIHHPAEADGVVVGDGPLMLSAEDGRQMQRRIDAAPGGRGVGRGPAEASAESRDKDLVEVAGGPVPQREIARAAGAQRI